MRRIMLGMVAGAVTAFFFDPQNGDARRQRLQELWEDNRGLAEGAGQTATAAAKRARPALERAGRELTRSSRSGWQAPSSGVLTGILIGAAATGAALYLFDPADGSRRRGKLVALVTDKWQEAAETGQELAASSGDAARRIRRQAGDGRPGFRSRDREVVWCSRSELDDERARGPRG